MNPDMSGQIGTGAEEKADGFTSESRRRAQSRPVPRVFTDWTEGQLCRNMRRKYSSPARQVWDTPYLNRAE